MHETMRSIYDRPDCMGAIMFGLKPVYMLCYVAIRGTWLKFKRATINPMSPELTEIIVELSILESYNSNWPIGH